MSSSGRGSLNRRVVLGALAALPSLPALFNTPFANAETATPLASWNDGPAKQAILDFIRLTTDLAGKDFTPPEERIATATPDAVIASGAIRDAQSVA